MDQEDMTEAGITGMHHKVGMMLVSKSYDVSMIILIVIYCILIAIYFVLEDILFEPNKENGEPINPDIETLEKGFFVGELVILAIFCLDIALHIFAYGVYYLKDVWNIADLIVILFSVAAVLLDIFVNNETLSGILKIRGLMRLVRIFILLRKVNTIRVKRDRRLKMQQSQIKGIDLRTPQEIILGMLSNLRERVDQKDKCLTDLNYCIKMIASNQLYEASFIDDEEESSAKEGDAEEEKRLSEKKKNTQDVRAWHRQF